jgi:DNA-nicking Smr family endonuclease
MSEEDLPNGAIELPIDGLLDLHAFGPRDVPAVVADYVEAAAERGLAEIRIVHGRGIGVQRAVVHRVLRGHRLVEGFWDAPEAHLGATIVRLRHAG